MILCIDVCIVIRIAIQKSFIPGMRVIPNKNGTGIFYALINQPQKMQEREKERKKARKKERKKKKKERKKRKK